MYREPDKRLSTASQSIIVERLLAELPQHVPAPRPPPLRRKTQSFPAIDAGPVSPPFARRRPVTQVGRARSTTYQDDTAGVWVRVVFGVVLGVAMAFWPYRMCGIGLVGYLGGALMVMSAAIWSAVVAWNRRSAFAHILAIGLLMWGLALAGDQLLQRTGYAYAQLGWTCN